MLKTASNDVVKGEIERRLQNAEALIHQWNESAKRYESETAGYEEKLGLLKKEG